MSLYTSVNEIEMKALSIQYRAMINGDSHTIFQFIQDGLYKENRTNSVNETFCQQFTISSAYYYFCIIVRNKNIIRCEMQTQISDYSFCNSTVSITNYFPGKKVTYTTH